jgi:hypothetical protein
MLLKGVGSPHLPAGEGQIRRRDSAPSPSENSQTMRRKRPPDAILAGEVNLGQTPGHQTIPSTDQGL